MLPIERKIRDDTNINFSTTGDVRQLKLGQTVKRYKVRFNFTYTQGGAGGTLAPDSPYGLVKRFALQLGGGAYLREADARFWKTWNQIQRSGVPDNFLAPSTSPNAVTNAFLEFTADLSQPDMLPGYDDAYVLDTRLLSGIDAIFDWGAASDVMSGNPGTLSAPELIITEEDDPGFVGESSRRQITKKQYQSSSLSAGDNDMNINAKGPLYRAIAVWFRSGASDPNAATGDDTFCNNVSLIGDNGFRYLDQVPYKQIQQKNKQVYNMQGGWPAGLILLDYAETGTIRNLLPTKDVKNPLTLRVNLTNSLPANPQILVYLINDVLVLRAGGGAPAKALVGTRR
jgi:hypothetical protein